VILLTVRPLSAYALQLPKREELSMDPAHNPISPKSLAQRGAAQPINKTPLDSVATPPPGGPAFAEYGSLEGFDQKYLNQYYGPPAKADEIFINNFLVSELERLKAARDGRQFDQYVEVGCGPTIHHAVPFATYAKSIVLTEYLPDNRETVRRWFNNEPGAFDWAHYIHMSLIREGVTPKLDPRSPEWLEQRDEIHEALREREDLLRGKLISIGNCDVRRPQVVSIRPALSANSVVGCFYVTEEVGTSIEDWKTIMRNIALTLPQGCQLFMSALKGMSEYVMEKDAAGNPTATLPCAPVEGFHFKELLPQLGFEDIRVEELNIRNPDCDVTGVIVVSARKAQPAGEASRLA
jgi:hypothetical protein